MGIPKKKESIPSARNREQRYREEQLGGCPRIGIFSQIEALKKNKHSHMNDIASIIFVK